MKRHFIQGILAVTLVLTLLSAANAAVETNIYRKLKLKSVPMDVKISKGGEWIFSLTDNGAVEIYTPEGSLMDTVSVGKEVDQIDVGPRENILLLKSSSLRTVEILILDFIRDIDITGAPIKGKAGAPVTLAVFSDFQ